MQLHVPIPLPQPSVSNHVVVADQMQCCCWLHAMAELQCTVMPVPELPLLLLIVWTCGAAANNGSLALGPSHVGFNVLFKHAGDMQHVIHHMHMQQCIAEHAMLEAARPGPSLINSFIGCIHAYQAAAVSAVIQCASTSNASQHFQHPCTGHVAASSRWRPLSTRPMATLLWHEGSPLPFQTFGLNHTVCQCFSYTVDTASSINQVE